LATHIHDGRNLTRQEKALTDRDAVDRARSDSVGNIALSSPAVSLENVSRRFGEYVAVDGISFDVEQGEFFSIIGPSGSGKTTTIRMIAGLEALSEGKISFFGESVVGIPPYQRDCPMVFQHFALFPHLNVIENVAFPLRMRGEKRSERSEAAEKALETVGLAGLGGRQPNQLSGGQQQRVALARAIVARPRVLLLDEALGSIDAALRIEMQAELRRLQRVLGCVVIHVTHDQSEALAMADRILVLNAGRIEQLASPQDIFSRPATRFVAKFVGNNNLIDGYVTGISKDEMEIATPLGTFVCLGPRKDLRGQHVTLVIRPDTLKLVDTKSLENRTQTPNPSRFQFPATVVGAKYEGASVTYSVTTETDPTLSLSIEENAFIRAMNPCHPGDEVIIEWQGGSPHILSGTPSTDREVNPTYEGS
jgi:ABC-type Fe3+/spermidine/putrescine transport system ATPase subunit